MHIELGLPPVTAGIQNNLPSYHKKPQKILSILLQADTIMKREGFISYRFDVPIKFYVGQQHWLTHLNNLKY